MAAVSAFLSMEPASDNEWEARAARIFPAGTAPNPVHDFALAYAYLLGRRFEAAARTIERIYASGEQSDNDALPVLLAWAYLETGRAAEAQPLLRTNPAPSVSGTGPFLVLYFPRLFYLRGLSAGRQGKPEEASAQFELFRKLSGPTPLIWGEEAQAK